MRRLTVLKKMVERSDSRILYSEAHGGYPEKFRNRKFTVPKNVFIIFASKPGYWLSDSFTDSESYQEIVDNEEEFKKYLLGKRHGPRNFVNWKDHVYIPGDTVNEFRMSQFDRLEFINKANRVFPNRKAILLSEIALKPYNSVVIIFIVACRHMTEYHNFYEKKNPTIWKRSPQNYNLPSSVVTPNILKNIRKREKMYREEHVYTPSYIDPNKPKPKRLKT